MLFSSVELVDSLSSPFGETELAVVVLVFTGSLAFLLLDALFFLGGFFGNFWLLPESDSSESDELIVMEPGLDVVVFLFLLGSFFVGFLVVPELFELEIEVVFVVVGVIFGRHPRPGPPSDPRPEQVVFVVVIVGRHLVDPRPEPRPEELPAGELRDEEVLDEEGLQTTWNRLDPERWAPFLVSGLRAE